MKKLITACFPLIIFSLSLFSQNNNALPIDEETGLITYQEVVDEEGTKQEFFNRAIGWINEYYTNPVDVTKTRDPESGKIKGIHRFKIKDIDEEGTNIDAGVIQYEFLLELKDGRYRYTLTNFVLRQSSKIPVENWLDNSDSQSKSHLKQLNTFAQDWIKSLKEGMKPQVEKNNDEW